MKKAITQYYDRLATKYDQDRFGNSYGQYIDAQEIRILQRYISTDKISKSLDIACGTGRFLAFAKYGLDISPKMVNIAQQKHPNKIINVGDIENLPFEHSFFQQVICFHLFMHLEYNQLASIFAKVSNIVQKDGLFIFDIPSKRRRKLTRYQATSWHGGNQISPKDLKAMTSNNWELVAYHGIAFLPLHLLPKQIRKYIRPLDSVFGNSFIKEWSSHIIYILKKK